MQQWDKASASCSQCPLGSRILMGLILSCGLAAVSKDQFVGSGHKDCAEY